MKDNVDLEYQALISERMAMHTANWVSTHDDDYNCRGIKYGEECFRETAKKFRDLDTNESAKTVHAVAASNSAIDEICAAYRTANISIEFYGWFGDNIDRLRKMSGACNHVSNPPVKSAEALFSAFEEGYCLGQSMTVINLRQVFNEWRIRAGT
jgi:hypothetical protein